jgi:hypothetical protein
MKKRQVICFEIDHAIFFQRRFIFLKKVLIGEAMLLVSVLGEWVRKADPYLGYFPRRKKV